MRRFFGLIVVLASLLVASCNSNSQQLLNQAEARWREGNYDDAIRLNTLLFERDKGGKYAARALLNIADIYYLNLRQLGNAIEYYKKVTEELPGTPEECTARLQLAAIYENELRDLTQAIYEYDQILKTQNLENRGDIEFRRAKAYFANEEYDRALRVLRRLEESGTTGHLLDQIRLKIGDIYEVQKRYDDAVAEFQQVIDSPCIDCRRKAILSLGASYEAVFDFDRAIETIRKLDHTPENDDRVRLEVVRLEEKKRRVDSGSVLTWQASQPVPVPHSRKRARP